MHKGDVLHERVGEQLEERMRATPTGGDGHEGRGEQIGARKGTRPWDLVHEQVGGQGANQLDWAA